MSSNHNRMSPRQRMINLMYLVLTAMLALNVSSDVLDGLSQVDSGLLKTNRTLMMKNDALLAQIGDIARVNPVKASVSAADAAAIALVSDSLLTEIDALKLDIAREADGKNAQLDNLKNRENLDAASTVMLSPVTRRGFLLKQKINSYSDQIADILPAGPCLDGIKNTLSTDKIETVDGPVDWEIAKFEHQPAIAAMTQLTKLQGDILHAESEALTALLDRIDADDLRVNHTDAFVIPRSDVVMSGSVYEADIVLAAVDSTSRPVIEINGTRLPDGTQVYKALATAPGKVTYRGIMNVTERDGSIRELPFEGRYDVIEPTATVSATMMNIMYSGIDNPVKVSVPGVIDDNVIVEVKGGQLFKTGKKLSVRPDNGADRLTVSVKARYADKITEVANTEFKVRSLPSPLPHIIIDDGRYKGGVPALSRRQLMSSPGIGAAIDDGILDITYEVLSFETLFFDSMGNVIPEKSEGWRFSSRQKDRFRKLGSGARFFVSGVKAKGPDGIVRQLSPIEVILN